jgi:D-alanyl-D-alanine carboxypeptidase-like protein
VIRPPHGFDGIVKAYGDPRDFLGSDGWMGPEETRAWEQRLELVRVPFPEPLQLSWGHPGQTVALMRCHPEAADSFKTVFATLKAEGLWRDLKTYGGCFVPRMQRGSGDKWSTHTWGVAMDVDVSNNKLGDEPRISLAVVQIFEANGFTWGGRWRRPDGQHFQLCTGY